MKIPKRGEERQVHLARVVFWSTLLVILFANVLVTIILIPIFLVLRGSVLYSTIVLLGAVTGMIYAFFSRDAGYFQHHHRLAAAILPLFALGNVVLVVVASNKLMQQLFIENTTHNPWIGGGVFAIAFLVPYVIMEWCFPSLPTADPG